MHRIFAASSVVCFCMCADAQDRPAWSETELPAPTRVSSTQWSDDALLSDLRALGRELSTGNGSQTASGSVSTELPPSVELGVRIQPDGQGAPVQPSFQEHYWFLRAGIGPSFAADSNLSINFAQPDNKVRFDPELRADIACGYQFTPWFGLEGELGLTSNSLRSIEGSPDVNGDFEQFANLVNAVFKLPTSSGFEPYLGVGAGLSIDVLNIQNGSVQGTPLHGYDGAAALAFQAAAGFRWRLSDRWNLAVEYEFLTTTRPEFDLAQYTPARTSGTLVLRNPRSHSLTASFVFKF